MKKRIFALLLALMLTLQLCPVSAMAANPPRSELTQVVTLINSDNPDLVAPTEFISYTELPPVEPDADVTYATTLNDATNQLREGMVDRVEEVTVYYRTNYPVDFDDCRTILYETYKHTGVSTQGEALKYCWQKCSYSISSSQNGSYYDNQMTFYLEYKTSLAEEQALTNKINAVLRSFNFTSTTSEYEKVKAIYDYITANITYDYCKEGDPNYLQRGTPYAAMIKGTAICNGYALLFYRMCIEAGLQCRYIHGDTESGGYHAWNTVKVCEYYYYVDATWDAGSSPEYYRWFLRGSNGFPDHIPRDPNNTPEFYAEHPVPSSNYDPNSTPHSPVYENVVNATCESNGLSGGSVCRYCGKVFATQTVIPALGHDYICTAIVDATCTEDGAMHYVCQNDNSHIYTETTPALGHDYVGTTLTVATCTEDGTMLYVCQNDDSHTYTETTPALGHDYVGTTLIAATCTEDGLMYYTCLIDNSHIYTETIPAKGHNFADGVCTACGEVDADYVPAISGNWNGVAYSFADGTLTIYVDKTQHAWDTQLPNVSSSIDTPWYTKGFSEDITEIVIEDGITGIGSFVFSDLPNLQTVTIADSVERIGMYAFLICQNLKQVTLPAGLKHIGANAFGYCSSIEEIILPEGTESIDSFAFGSCTSLSKLELSASMKTLGAYFIDDCPSLKTLELPANIESIHSYAFYKSNLTDLYYPGSEAQFKALMGISDGNTINLLPGITVHYGIVETPTPVNPFTDIAELDYFFDPVMWAVQQGITTGTSTTTFSPTAECSRGQVVTFLWRAMGKPEAANRSNPFTDVRTDDYFYEAVLWAVEQGITSGTSATTFSPDDACTRAQVATFLWRTMGKPEPSTLVSPFNDIATNMYYYNAVLWAVENNVTTGMGSNAFAPDYPCTRGQIVTFLYRAQANK